MMKKVFATLVATTVLALAGCAGSVGGAAGTQRAASFWAWVEDAAGDEIVNDVVITIDGFAEGPNGEPDVLWADTGLSAALPLELHKRAPFEQPIYWPQGYTVYLQVTVIFEDAQLGDQVQCWQDYGDGQQLKGSFRSTTQNLPQVQPPLRGPISVNCSFIFH